jgi:Flp pilus assembly protein TadD
VAINKVFLNSIRLEDRRMNINNAIKSAFENYQAGNLLEAVNICQVILNVHPDNIDAINLLGVISYQQKDYDSAIKCTKKLISLNPNNAQAYFILGHSMQEKGELDEAIAHYQKSLQLNPNLADAYYNLGTIFQDKKRNNEAISCYEKVLQLTPNDIDAYYNLGLVFKDNEQLENSISSFQKALQLNPNLADANTQLGLILESSQGSLSKISPMKPMIEKNEPPKEIPKELYNEFTMGDKIKVTDCYVNEAYPPVEAIIYDEKIVNGFLKEVGNKATNYYGITDKWLYQAIEKYIYVIKDQRVVVMGSRQPWYESICMHYGGKVTTIEYNKIISKYPLLTTITPSEYDKNPITFDAALSISSFEHDGLGRYGDPINPKGDLEAMKKMKTILNRGGILFLSVPVGKDTLVWNAHRIYGKVRLPLLMEGWQIIDTFGYDDNLLDFDFDILIQPIFVLVNI